MAKKPALKEKHYNYICRILLNYKNNPQYSELVNDLAVGFHAMSKSEGGRFKPDRFRAICFGRVKSDV